MSPLSREAIWAVLSGLTVLGCDKAPSVTAEPAQAATSAAPAAASAATPSAPAAAVSAALPAGSTAPGAKEVKPAQGKGSEKEKTCSPGGCAPGQCGAGK